MNVCKIRYKEVIKILFIKKKLAWHEQVDAVVSFLFSEWNLVKNESDESALREKLKKCFMSNFTQRLKKLSKNRRNLDDFVHSYEEWVDRELVFTPGIAPQNPVTERIPKKRGRPSKKFVESSKKTKQTKTMENSKRIGTEEVYDLAKKKLKSQRNNDGLKIFEKILNPKTAKIIHQDMLKPKSRPLSAEEAVVFMLDGNLTKAKYIMARTVARNANHDLYPPYEKVLNAKKEAYPVNMFIDDNTCKISLQDLVENTVHRLIKFLKIQSNSKEDLILDCKYGMDGSTVDGYRQSSDSTNEVVEHIFCVSMVPLRLINKNNNAIYWENPKSSSTRFCRPLLIYFQKETVQLCKEVEEDINLQIKKFKKIEINGFSVGINMMLTMCDGKVINGLNDSSSQRCYICRHTISDLNKLDILMKAKIRPKSLKYSLSILHAWIRILELVLHISYRLNLGIWKVPENKRDEFNERKKYIQEQLKKKLKILVDYPTKKGGNTNTGNTARKFFANTEIVSEITGFNLELLNRFKTILTAISCGHDINTNSFNEYCFDTAKLYVSLYSWYYMAPSLHELLVHGAQIIESLDFPIGLLSEESQESNNKNISNYRERFTRKFSRTVTNSDLFHRLFLNSDPYFSMIRDKPKSCHKEFSEDVKSLLQLNQSTEILLDEDEQEVFENEEDNEDGESIDYLSVDNLKI